MQIEKEHIIRDLLDKLNASPFLLVADYSGLTVSGFDELRNRLRETGAECHVVKNTYVKRAAKEAGLPDDIRESLVGQTCVITGEDDICAASKVLKDFHKEFEKPETKVGVLDGKFLSADEVKVLAGLPAKDVLRAQFLATLMAPATNLVRTLNEPAASFARLMKAKEEKG